MSLFSMVFESGITLFHWKFIWRIYCHFYVLRFLLKVCLIFTGPLQMKDWLVQVRGDPVVQGTRDHAQLDALQPDR